MDKKLIDTYVTITITCGMSKEEFEIPYEEYKEMLAKLRLISKTKTNN